MTRKLLAYCLSGLLVMTFGGAGCGSQETSENPADISSSSSSLIASFTQGTNERGEDRRTLPDLQVTQENPTPSIDFTSQFFGDRGGQNHPTMIPLSNESCDPTMGFICLDKPTTNSAVATDAINVKGRINGAKLIAVDPAQAASIIVSKVGGSTNTYFVALDLSNMGVQDVNQAVTLSGPGIYTITLQATNKDTQQNEAVSATNVQRVDVPVLEWFRISPLADPNPGNILGYQSVPPDTHKDISVPSNTDTEIPVSMDSVVVRVHLKDGGSEGAAFQFKNYDKDGKIISISNGDSSNGSPLFEQDGQGVFSVKPATIPLINGYNRIEVTAHNTAVDALQMKQVDSTPIHLIFNNQLPRVKIKLISPLNNRIFQPSGNNDLVNVSFCITDFPKITGVTQGSPAGECLKTWGGQAPELWVNNVRYSAQDPERPLNVDGSGIYSVKVKPSFGNNIIRIHVSFNQFGIDDSLESVFAFGRVNPLFEDDHVTLKESRNFLARKLSLEVNKKIIDQVRDILEDYLNKPDFLDSIKSGYKTNSPSSPSVCTEYGEPAYDAGDTTIDLFKDFKIQGLHIQKLEPRSADSNANFDYLLVQVKVDDIHGRAALRNVQVPPPENNPNIQGYIPLKFHASAQVNVGVRFVRRSPGIMNLDIFALKGLEVVNLTGKTGFGDFVSIDDSVPAGQGIANLDAVGGLVTSQFIPTLNRTLLCSVEKGINPPDNYNIDNPPSSGVGYWISEIRKVIDWDNTNPLRIPIEFDLLGKPTGATVALNPFVGSDIGFTDKAIQVKDVPVRITPPDFVLKKLLSLATMPFSSVPPEDKELAGLVKSGSLGSLSAPLQNDEVNHVLPSTNGFNELALSLPEDAINQFLFSANLAGMFDLDIDPSFLSDNDIDPINQATLTVGDILGNSVDINGNGVLDDINAPVHIKLRTNKAFPPSLHWLNSEELAELSKHTEKPLNQKLKFFRLTLTNAVIGIYRVDPLPLSQGGYKQYCVSDNDVLDNELRHNVPSLYEGGGENGTNLLKGMAQKFKPVVERKIGKTCEPGFSSLQINALSDMIPVRNSPTLISAIPGSSEPVPWVAVKLNLVIHGVVQGAFSEVLNQDRYDLGAAAQPTNFVRIKILDQDINTTGPGFIADFQVLQNRTPFTADELTQKLSGVIIPNALSGKEASFGEIRIALPEGILKPEANVQPSGLSETLADFGIGYFQITSTGGQYPHLPVIYNLMENQNKPLDFPYLDLTAHLGICYQNADHSPILDLPSDPGCWVVKEVIEKPKNLGDLRDQMDLYDHTVHTVGGSSPMQIKK